MGEPFNPLAWIDNELESLDALSLRRTLRVRSSPQGPAIALDGTRRVNFGSNDYLGLAGDERLAAAAAQAAADDGWGAGASPLITGRSTWHARLEARLAEHEGTEAALVFTSGYAANVGTICALVGREDAVFGDEKNHASIIDGCRLSRAAVHVYPHSDVDRLATLLEGVQDCRRRLIVTDSVFSMDGDLAPLAALAELAAKHRAMLMVDEAHATGVFGHMGRGLAEAVGVEQHVDVRMGTLSKALGSAGGFVAGRRTLIDWLVNRARSYVFSTAPPPAASAAAVAALDLVAAEPHRRRELLERAGKLRDQLCAQGWNVGRSASQIIPVIVGDPQHALALADRLASAGLLVPAIRPPSVPHGQSLLRISLSWAHDEEALARLTTALASAAQTMLARFC